MQARCGEGSIDDYVKRRRRRIVAGADDGPGSHVSRKTRPRRAPSTSPHPMSAGRLSPPLPFPSLPFPSLPFRGSRSRIAIAVGLGASQSSPGCSSRGPRSSACRHVETTCVRDFDRARSFLAGATVCGAAIARRPVMRGCSSSVAGWSRARASTEHVSSSWRACSTFAGACIEDALSACRHAPVASGHVSPVHGRYRGCLHAMLGAAVFAIACSAAVRRARDRRGCKRTSFLSLALGAVRELRGAPRARRWKTTFVGVAFVAVEPRGVTSITCRARAARRPSLAG